MPQLMLAQLALGRLLSPRFSDSGSNAGFYQLTHASNPRGQSRYISDQFSASSFALSMIRLQSLLACSQAAIFIGLSESFSTLLIASFLDWISFAFAFFFHKQ